MAAGAIWMVALQLVDRSIALVGMLILVRLLLPADFGFVAMATSFIALIELLGAFGFDTALIRLQAVTRHHLDTAWTLNVITGTVIATLLVTGSGVAAAYYNEPRLTNVIGVLAVSSIVGALENVGVVQFRIQLDFAAEFRFQLIKRLVAFSVTVLLAFILRSYWALIAGLIAGRVASTCGSYMVSSYRPAFSLVAVGELFNFSKWLLLNSMIGVLKERGFDFIVGRIAGVTSLGIFNVGSAIATMASTELVGPINRAVFPGYAKLVVDMPVLRKSFCSVMGVIALCVAPAGVGMAAIAPVACAVLLGPKWMSAVPIIEVMAIQGAVSALQTNMYSAYLAMNKPHVPMWTGGAYVAVLGALSIWLTRLYGVEGTAWACLITAIVFVPVNYVIVLHYLELGWTPILAQMWRPVVGSMAVWGAARWVVIALGEIQPPFVAMIIAIGVGGFVYVVVVGGLWWLSGHRFSAERIVLDRVMVGRQQTSSG